LDVTVVFFLLNVAVNCCCFLYDANTFDVLCMQSPGMLNYICE